MHTYKRLLSVALAVLLTVGVAATAQAGSYNVADGFIVFFADSTSQTVHTISSIRPPIDTAVEDASPVFFGSSDEHFIGLEAMEGVTAELTLDNVSITSAYYLPTLTLEANESRIHVTLNGKNEVFGSQTDDRPAFIVLGTGADTSAVSLDGDGSLTATSGSIAGSYAIFVDDAALCVDGGSLTADSPVGYGIGLFDGATLSVSEDYLHPACVTASGGEGSFDCDDTSEVILGKNNFVLDENGRDITAEVLANPALLKILKYVIIATKDIAVFPSGNMKSDVHMMTAYKNTRFEQTGEPSAEAMKALSAGQNGDALYAGSFAFTDDIRDHGKFQVNIMLPQYAGQHVKLVTLDNGTAVAYDRWVGNDGLVWCHVDHLGDFAVFAA